MLLSAYDTGRPAAPAGAADATGLRELYETVVLMRLFEAENDRQYTRNRLGG